MVDINVLLEVIISYNKQVLYRFSKIPGKFKKLVCYDKKKLPLGTHYDIFEVTIFKVNNFINGYLILQCTIAVYLSRYPGTRAGRVSYISNVKMTLPPTKNFQKNKLKT